MDYAVYKLVSASIRENNAYIQTLTMHCQVLHEFILLIIQVVTALLVAGPTLTLWIPGQLCLHPPTRTQALFKGCLCNVGSSLWLVPINAL